MVSASVEISAEARESVVAAIAAACCPPGGQGRWWRETSGVADDAWQRLAIGRIPIAAWSGYAWPNCGRAVRRLLTATAAAVLLGGPAMAQVDPKIKSECMKAQDFVGCVKAMSGNLDLKSDESPITRLREALKLLPDRLSNTNLRDFTSNVQVFFDAVSLVDISKAKNEYEKELISEAIMIKGMTNALQDYWSTRISDGTYYGTSGYRSYYCRVLSPRLEIFNTFAGDKYRVSSNVSTANSWLLGEMQTCYPQESQMVGSINRRVADALVDPEVRKAELERKQKEEALAKLEPWLRHLKENPKLKKWVDANPSAGKAFRAKWEIDQQKNKVEPTMSTVNIKNNFVKDCGKQPSKDLYTKCITNGK